MREASSKKFEVPQLNLVQQPWDNQYSIIYQRIQRIEYLSVISKITLTQYHNYGKEFLGFENSN